MVKALTRPNLQKLPKGFTPDSALRDYGTLKARVYEVLILGRNRIEKEFMRMRYHTGLLINEHVRLNGGRAAYGTQAVLKLEKDFDIDHTELLRYAQFAKAYPIVGGRRQLAFNLPWTHYRKLMIIPDDKLRRELVLEAERQEWPFQKIEARVRHCLGRETEGKAPERLPAVLPGPLGMGKIIRLSGPLLLDLGFKVRLEMGVYFPRARFQEGMIVKTAERSFKLARVQNAEEDNLYTYRARVEEIIDGDTLKVDFLPGPGLHKGETIRLNHIDCPEITTPEGKAARRFVESELAGAELITVKSVRTRKEKWGRYLGDVFYEKKGRAGWIYLNQLLLDQGYAVRVRK